MSAGPGFPPLSAKIMNAKHAETSIKISEESHTGPTLFIPYCDTQGCQWIGSTHSDKLSAQKEGRDHLDKLKPKPGRTTIPGAMTLRVPTKEPVRRVS